jgi:protein-S-isoprenylcysteine O-methyltransferase Ste14
VVFLLLAAAMYGVDRALPGLRFDFPGRRELVWIVAACGFGVAVAAAIAFAIHRTTIDPRKPERTRALVTGGVYRFSRNPIYLGDTVLLLAWALYLANPLAFAIVPAFVAWMNAFQIAAEERFLRARFGAAYHEYGARVRRWLGVSGLK